MSVPQKIDIEQDSAEMKPDFNKIAVYLLRLYGLSIHVFVCFANSCPNCF